MCSDDYHNKEDYFQFLNKYFNIKSPPQEKKKYSEENFVKEEQNKSCLNNPIFAYFNLLMTGLKVKKQRASLE